MSARIFTSRDELAAAVGTELGSSEWMNIDQERINEFASATEDFQWIHVDPERAASGPFGATIAHGFLTVSLLPVLLGQIYKVQAKMAVNYGLNKLRFPSPVRVGSSVRGSSSLVEVTDVGDAVQLIVKTVIELKDSEKPAAVAESVSRYYW
jgi:acyl dehydratase